MQRSRVVALVQRMRFCCKLLNQFDRPKRPVANGLEFQMPCDSTFFTAPQVKFAKGMDATVCGIFAGVCEPPGSRSKRRAGVIRGELPRPRSDAVPAQCGCKPGLLFRHVTIDRARSRITR